MGRAVPSNHGRGRQANTGVKNKKMYNSNSAVKYKQ